MEDDLNCRQSQWKIALMEEGIHERCPKWNPTQMEKDLNKRQF